MFWHVFSAYKVLSMWYKLMWLLSINSGYKGKKKFTAVWFPIKDGAYRHHLYSRFVVHYEDTIHRVSQESYWTYTAFVRVIPHTEFSCVFTQDRACTFISTSIWGGGMSNICCNLTLVEEVHFIVDCVKMLIVYSSCTMTLLTLYKECGKLTRQFSLTEHASVETKPRPIISVDFFCELHWVIYISLHCSWKIWLAFL
jgi:hypothetical protein